MNWKEVLGIEKKEEVSLEQEYAELLMQAKRDLDNAKAYFESVSDSDLVDFAIFDMEAARLKYTYLLRKIRSMWDKGTA